jgi:3-hydroxyacyl-CoA dehydrogenase
MKHIRHVTVLGAGVMGSQIAAHLANAGVPVLLLDVSPEAARDGLQKATKLKPNPFFTAAGPRLVSTGGFDEGLPGASRSDWIIEAIVERLDIKQSLLERLEAVRRPDAIVSSNTSGIPLHAIAEGRSESFRRHWLGTHFFNPPRYLRLVEIIPTADTDPAVTQAIADFADRRLGKGVVPAKDTPNFIGNHLVMHGVLRTFEVLAAGAFTVEEIDAITGPAIGRPKSATFRTIDIAGLDVLAHVARNLGSELPPFVHAMLERGLIGEKAGQGFYKKVKQPDGSSDILVLDIPTMEYRAQQKPKFGSIEAARSIEDAGERIRALFLGQDKVGDFLRATLGETLLYTARVTPGIAHSIDDVDRAMRWGFAWELGPFETWDAIGLRAVLEACGVAEADAPELVRERLAAEGERGTVPLFRLGVSGTDPLFPGTGAKKGDCPTYSQVPPAAPDLQILRTAKDQHRLVRRNAGASLVDLGDGVLAVEFHSKMNAIGGDTIAMLDAGVKEAARNFAALVVGNDAPNFSAGANLMLLLLEAQEANWDEVDLMVRAFQGATMALRLSAVPVVVAPAGLTLGGGCEIALHGDRVQAAAETYIGLVEAGVGLIPAGGGTKEMLARANDTAPPGTRPPEGGPAGVRDDRLRQGLHQRARGAPARLPARRRRDHDEPRAADERRQGGGARPRARRLRPAPTPRGDPRRRRHRARGAQARRPSRVARRPHQRARQADRREARVGAGRRQPAARHRGERTAVARPRARGVSQPLRPAENAGTHRAHAQNRSAVEKLTMAGLRSRVSGLRQWNAVVCGLRAET